MIRAYATIPTYDDVRFDISPWFEKATPKTILKLAENEWSDSVILRTAAKSLVELEGYANLGHLLGYKARHRTGFRGKPLELDIYIDPIDAMKWLEAERHDVHDMIVAEVDDPTFTSPRPSAWQNPSETEADYLRLPDAAPSPI